MRLNAQKTANKHLNAPSSIKMWEISRFSCALQHKFTRLSILSCDQQHEFMCCPISSCARQHEFSRHPVCLCGQQHKLMLHPLSSCCWVHELVRHPVCLCAWQHIKSFISLHLEKRRMTQNNAVLIKKEMHRTARLFQNSTIKYNNIKPISMRPAA